MRDKEAINAMLAEVGGASVAKGNVTATAKVQKQIIGDFLGGNGRKKVKDWTPRYMAFPMGAYTSRDGLEPVNQYKAVKKYYVS